MVGRTHGDGMRERPDHGEDDQLEVDHCCLE
jgi:hypothetical protein